jgi:hypothetical protein
VRHFPDIANCKKDSKDLIPVAFRHNLEVPAVARLPLILTHDAVNIGEMSCDGVFSALRVYALRRICLLRNSPASSFVLVSLPVTLDSLNILKRQNVS